MMKEILEADNTIRSLARYSGQPMKKEDFLKWKSDDNFLDEWNDGINGLFHRI